MQKALRNTKIYTRKPDRPGIAYPERIAVPKGIRPDYVFLVLL